MKIGSGWDSHRLVNGRPLILGGVHIDADRGEAGHSDGDVLAHALIDALLGASVMGDIGTHFPPSESRWKDADSMGLLETVYRKITAEGLTIHNIDATIILEQPKLSSYIDTIRDSIAASLSISPSQISVKAKTAEGLGPVGEGLSIEAYVSLLLDESTPDIWV
jgi:2-C-methyl-D-erythritol 2,4-cyclodiphosphate synthase